MENKFKKGDWVRRVEKSDYPWLFGEVGEIYKVLDANVGGIIVVDGAATALPSAFEPWRPKVGERVRFVRDSTAGGEMYGAKGDSATVVGEHRTDGHVRTYVDVKIDNSSLCFDPSAYVDDLEPLPFAAEAQPAAPAPLTIKSGKFYKTRDGRKVGPMKQYGSKWPFKDSQQGGAFYEADGKAPYLSDDHDLIAEWVDAPATAPVRDITAATVDAINDEYGPVVSVAEQPARFKVGDRVKVIKLGFEKGGSSHWAEIGDEFVLHKMNTDKTFWYTVAGPDFYPHEIELVAPPTTAIVCLIENGQPLPADRPAVHTRAEAADAEAKRLASLHKGQEFGVYALTGTPHKVAKVYEHEWQRLAAEGRRPLAVSSLVRAAGISQRQAESIVCGFAA